MYAIRTRSGTVYMKIKRNFGDLSALEVGSQRQGRGGAGQGGGRQLLMVFGCKAAAGVQASWRAPRQAPQRTHGQVLLGRY